MSGDAPESRFEYRVFASDLEALHDAFAAASSPEATETSEHLYLVGARLDRNVKLRDGAIDRKALREEHRGLERWEPLPRVGLPVEGAWVRDALSESLGVPALDAPRERYSREALLAEVVERTAGVRAIHVRKRRERFSLRGVRAEFARLHVAGPLQTVAVESIDPEAVLREVRRLGLGRWRNTSYVRLLRDR